MSDLVGFSEHAFVVGEALCLLLGEVVVLAPVLRDQARADPQPLRRLFSGLLVGAGGWGGKERNDPKSRLATVRSQHKFWSTERSDGCADTSDLLSMPTQSIQSIYHRCTTIEPSIDYLDTISHVLS